MRKNIILTGMPSSGKTTIGQPLSKELDMKFIDTDKIIFDRENKPLKDIVNENGLDTFLKIQEEVLLDIDVEGCVISTGGSVIYNKNGMEHLKKNGLVIFLKLELEDIESRIVGQRRFARNENQSFGDLYKERLPLYEKYCDIVVDCDNKSVDELVSEIKEIYLKN